MTWTGQETLQEVHSFLTEHWVDGAPCPACTQLVKLYFRPLNYDMGWLAVQLYLWDLGHPGEFCYLPDLVRGRKLGGGDYAKLAGFGVIEPDGGLRTDGSKRTGYWRLTDTGRDWAARRIRLPRYVRQYNNQYFGDPTPYTAKGELCPLISVDDALGNPHEYSRLMAGEG